jgi:hypothetical protein
MFKRKKGPQIPKYESQVYDSPEERTKGITDGMKKEKRQAIINHIIRTGLLSTALTTLAYFNGNFNPSKPTVIGTNPQRDVNELIASAQEIHASNDVPFTSSVQAAIKIQKGERLGAEHYLSESNVQSLLDKCDSLETYQSIKPKEKVTGRDLQKFDPRLQDFFERAIDLKDQTKIEEFKSFILQTQQETGTQIFISENVKMSDFKTRNSLEAFKKSIFIEAQTIKATDTASVYKGVSLYSGDSKYIAHKSREKNDHNDYVGINTINMSKTYRDEKGIDIVAVNTTETSYHEILGHWGNVSNRLRACISINKMRNSGQSVQEAAVNLTKLLDIASEDYDYSKYIKDSDYGLWVLSEVDVIDTIAKDLLKDPVTESTGSDYSIINYLKVAAKQVRSNMIQKKILDQSLNSNTREAYIKLYNSLPYEKINPMHAFSTANFELEATSVEVLSKLGIDALDDKSIRDYIQAQLYVSGITDNMANTDFEYIKMAMELNKLTFVTLSINTKGPLNITEANKINSLTSKMQAYLREHKRACTDADFKKFFTRDDLFKLIKEKQTFDQQPKG